MKEAERELIEPNEIVLESLVAWVQAQRTEATVALRADFAELQRRLLESEEMSAMWSDEVDRVQGECERLRLQIAALSSVAEECKEQLLRLEAQRDALVDQVSDLRRQLRKNP